MHIQNFLAHIQSMLNNLKIVQYAVALETKYLEKIIFLTSR